MIKVLLLQARGRIKYSLERDFIQGLKLPLNRFYKYDIQYKIKNNQAWKLIRKQEQETVETKDDENRAMGIQIISRKRHRL